MELLKKTCIVTPSSFCMSLLKLMRKAVEQINPLDLYLSTFFICHPLLRHIQDWVVELDDYNCVFTIVMVH